MDTRAGPPFDRSFFLDAATNEVAPPNALFVGWKAEPLRHCWWCSFSDFATWRWRIREENGEGCCHDRKHASVRDGGAGFPGGFDCDHCGDSKKDPENQRCASHARLWRLRVGRGVSSRLVLPEAAAWAGAGRDGGCPLRRRSAPGNAGSRDADRRGRWSSGLPATCPCREQLGCIHCGHAHRIATGLA